MQMLNTNLLGRKRLLRAAAISSLHAVVFLWCYAMVFLMIPDHQLGDVAKGFPSSIFIRATVVLAYPLLIPLLPSRPTSLLGGSLP